MPKDYYAILGVDKSASESEIKWAFRQKAKSLHPDVNRNDDAQLAFQELNEAYSILSDSSTRARYDNGDLDEPEVTFTWEELEQILREREIKREKDWREDFGYPGENIYPPPDYKANERTAQMVNLGLLLFAFTFIMDYFIFFDIGSEKIIAKRNVVATVKGGPPLAWTEVKIESLEFNINLGKYTPEVGDSVELKKSLFYGERQYKTMNSNKFIRADKNPFVIYMMAGLTCLIAWLGTTTYFNPERKYNAAVIAAFLCVAMIVILLYPK